MHRVFFGALRDTSWNLQRLKNCTRNFFHTAIEMLDRYDVVRAIEEFSANPQPSEVYNLGGGRQNSISVLESIVRVEEMTRMKLNWYYVEDARKGDHICYISDLRNFQIHYPNWRVTRNLDTIFEEIISAQRAQPMTVASTD